MLLEPNDIEIFFRLHRALMFFVSQRLNVVPLNLASPDDFANVSAELRLQIRNALKDKLELIDAFVAENQFALLADELEIVRSRRHAVAGRFYIFRELKQYAVFLSSTSPPTAYGVVALSQPFEELIGPRLPVLVDAVLLPFKGRIVYDSMLNTYNISFGGGIRRSLNESFKEAKARQGIVTSLPISDEPLPARTPKAKRAPKPPSKEVKDQTLEVIITAVEAFCKEHLNEEYAALCRRLAEKLARKRPSPLISGNPIGWASGIVRTIGWVNFLHDKSQTPHMRLSDIDAAFDVSESSGAANLAAIRKLLKIRQLDPSWTLPSRLDDNPLAWLVQVNGLMMDIRDCPRELQQMAFEKGLIPYIPADRRSDV